MAGAKKLIEDAKILEDAGVCSVLLEAVPSEVAQIITERSSVPVFGIGAGPHCDGQVLVIHDVLGIYDRTPPKFVKKYRELCGEIVKGLEEFASEVKAGAFPAREHCYPMPKEVADELKKLFPKE
jgi:3-methyl-2-oxobutanoate hydroxymethyltransferase